MTDLSLYSMAIWFNNAASWECDECARLWCHVILSNILIYNLAIHHGLETKSYGMFDLLGFLTLLLLRAKPGTIDLCREKNGADGSLFPIFRARCFSIYTAIRVADDYGDRREEAAETIRNRLYTDNYLDSADTDERRFLPHEMAVKHPLVQGSISAELLSRAGSVWRRNESSGSLLESSNRQISLCHHKTGYDILSEKEQLLILIGVLDSLELAGDFVWNAS